MGLLGLEVDKESNSKAVNGFGYDITIFMIRMSYLPTHLTQAV
jgi:hypothetical protein